MYPNPTPDPSPLGKGRGNTHFNAQCESVQRLVQRASPPLSQRGGAGGGVCNQQIFTHYYSGIQTPPLTPPLWERGGETRISMLNAQCTMRISSAIATASLPSPFTKGRGWGGGCNQQIFKHYYCCIQTPPLTPPLWERGGETRNRYIEPAEEECVNSS